MSSTSESFDPSAVAWLADAPLFIDTNLIQGFYDAVVKPENKKGETILEIGKEGSNRVKGTGGIDIAGELSAGSLLHKIFDIFTSIKVTGKVTGSAEAEKTVKKTDKETVKLYPIDTPQRQLVHLMVYYASSQPNRLSFVDKPYAPEWREPEDILLSPRKLVFLDLPSQAQVGKDGKLKAVKLIPTAAEFSAGKVVILYNHLRGKKNDVPPKYPEMEKELDEVFVDEGEKSFTISSDEQLQIARKKYWQWFDNNYNATQAMGSVEKAASENKKIQWIDFRLPIADDGSSLHLHIVPSGNYDTGSFAYN